MIALAALLAFGATWSGAATATIREFPIPPGSSPSGIASGPDGALWFADEGSNRIGRMTTSGLEGEYPIPTAGAGVGGLTGGPDGNIWFLETKAAKIARLVPSTGAITEFPTGVGGNGVVTGSDGNLWVAAAQANQILVVSTAGVVLRSYTVPTKNSFPHGPSLGPDGNVYFAEFNANRIGRISPTGVFKQWALPQAASQPLVTAFGPDGRLYATETGVNKIARLDPATNAIAQFAVPTPSSSPAGITAGSDGNIWFTETHGDKVGQLTLAGVVTEFPLPTASAVPKRITTGPDGNLWFSEAAANAIGTLVPPSFAPPVAPANTAPPIVSGSATVGQVLSASTGSWSGSPAPTFAYAWSSCDAAGANCAPIPGASGASYAPGSQDVGSTVLVTVTATNTAGSASAVSAPTGVVSAGTPPANVTPPGVTGSPVLGQQLTASVGTWTGASTFAFAWFSCDTSGANCVLIPGASSNLYTPGVLDVGSTLTVTVTASNAAGSTAASSQATAVVTAGTAPANTALPVITGTVTVGQPLTASPGSWSGSPAPSFAFAWSSCDASGANCVGLPGAVSASYTPTLQDVGSTLEVTVTASNAAGVSAATSQPTAVVSAGAPPVATAPPVVSGSPIVGQALTASTGSWSGSPSFTFSWSACDAAGSNCVSIPSASGQSYVPGAPDVGSTLVATVVATNAAGSASASSGPTAVVQAAGLGPTTPILDNFNRASGVPGANWPPIGKAGFAAIKIAGNAAADSSTTAFAFTYWKPSTFGPNCEAYLTVATYSSSDVIRLGARVSGAGTTAFSGYFVGVSGTGVWTILRIDNGGAAVTLATGPTQPIASGDKIAIRIIGSVVTALHATPTGWSQVMSYDTAGDAIRYAAAGSIAFEFKTSLLDDVGGGSLP